MRIFHTEFAHDYSTYAFGYQVHAELEPGESAREAYEHGFLPRSNEPERTNRFYLARSVRVPMDRCTFTSENRRILKKFDGLLAATFLTRDELRQDDEFRSHFLSYFAHKHGPDVMNHARLDGILQSVLPLRGIRYANDTGTVGYVVEAVDGPYAHYWYSAYRPDLALTHLGMWMMIDAVRRAKTEGRSHIYLGTAYGEKGRYKMNFEPLEFWNGESWSDDKDALKMLVKNDAKLIFKRT
ncbi:MAG TPA: GNAT family N-acetyltransferase [Candidatus Paceibacterota bacterium]|nr:GNAT family N-acetyltransferase [Candidatus Paceibacterota bacterium]